MVLFGSPYAWSAESLGVPQCDAYIQSMERCLESVPTSDRNILNESLMQSLEEWRRSVSAGNAASLVPQCQMALELARIATASYGCRM